MALSAYRTHPVHQLPEMAVESGYAALATTVARCAGRTAAPILIVIDGFSGVQWQEFDALLRRALEEADLSAQWLLTADCFLPPAQVDALLAPNLTDDPVFGRIFHGHLEELWDARRVSALREARRH